MGKKKNTFECSYCGAEIEYGDPNAVDYDGEIYCDTQCVVDSLDIDPFCWEDIDEFEIESDRDNGYCVRFIGENYYSNGHYLVFNKCPFVFDDEYKQRFDVKEAEKTDAMAIKLLLEFDANSLLFKEVRNFKPEVITTKAGCKRNYVYVLGHWFNREFYEFVLEQLNDGNHIPDVMSILVNDGKLYIVCNGKKAIITKDDDPARCPINFSSSSCEFA